MLRSDWGRAARAEVRLEDGEVNGIDDVVPVQIAHPLGAHLEVGYTTREVDLAGISQVSQSLGAPVVRAGRKSAQRCGKEAARVRDLDGIVDLSDCRPECEGDGHHLGCAWLRSAALPGHMAHQRTRSGGCCRRRCARRQTKRYL